MRPPSMLLWGGLPADCCSGPLPFFFFRAGPFPNTAELSAGGEADYFRSAAACESRCADTDSLAEVGCP